MIYFEWVYYLPLIVIYGAAALVVYKRKRLPISSQLVYFSLYIYIIWILSLTLFPIRIGQVPWINDLPNNFLPFSSILRQLKHEPFFQLVRQLGGNIAVFAPLGAFVLVLRGGRVRLLRVMATGFLFSLSIEVFQFFLSRILGMGFRVFDVDDIILNVLGTVLGFMAAKYAVRLKKERVAHGKAVQ